MENEQADAGRQARTGTEEKTFSLCSAADHDQDWQVTMYVSIVVMFHNSPANQSDLNLVPSFDPFFLCVITLNSRFSPSPDWDRSRSHTRELFKSPSRA